MQNKSIILVAEDDADDRFLLQTAFEQCRYSGTLSFVENGVEAMKYLQNAKQMEDAYPNLIMLDINMPKKDGYEVLKELKKDKVFEKIPVVVFSTAHNENELNKCIAMGANEYIVKPDSFEILLNIVADLTSRFMKPVSSTM